MSSTLHKLLMKADRLHRQYLLVKSPKRGGKIQCFITKRYFNSEDLEVAHFIDRAKECVRFYDLNCHLVVRASNRHDSGVYSDDLYGGMSKHHFEYKVALIDAYGQEMLDDLISYEDNCVGLSRQDIREYIIEFKQTIKDGGS